MSPSGTSQLVLIKLATQSCDQTFKLFLQPGLSTHQQKVKTKIQTSSQWSEGVKQKNSTIQSLRARPENMSSPILSTRGGVRKRLRIDAKIVFMHPNVALVLGNFWFLLQAQNSDFSLEPHFRHGTSNQSSYSELAPVVEIGLQKRPLNENLILLTQHYINLVKTQRPKSLSKSLIITGLRSLTVQRCFILVCF